MDERHRVDRRVWASLASPRGPIGGDGNLGKFTYGAQDAAVPHLRRVGEEVALLLHGTETLTVGHCGGTIVEAHRFHAKSVALRFAPISLAALHAAVAANPREVLRHVQYLALCHPLLARS